MTTHQNLLAMLALVLAGINAGCTVTQKADVKSVVLTSTTPKIDLRIALHLPTELCEYEYQYKSAMGDTYVTPLHGIFCDNSKSAANTVFGEVTVHHNEVPSSALEAIDAVLAPVVTSTAILPSPEHASGLHDLKCIVQLEWTLITPDGVPIWIQTFQGEGVSKAGTIFTMQGNRDERFQEAIDEVFKKSVEGMMSSSEIRSYVNRK